MDHDLEQFIADMFYFIKYAAEHEAEQPERFGPKNVLFTLAHDLAGVYKKDECFLPRVTGYKDQYLKSKGGRL
jgi:hypothetical protein